MRLWWLLLVLPATAGAMSPEVQQKVLTRARSMLGKPYQLGGRGRTNEGVDCQGLVFRALEAAMSCGYQSFSVLNVNNVRDRELGVPVPGLSPIASEALDPGKLQPGDVIWLVAADRNPAEGPIGQLDGVDVWVWHTGLYAGEGRWLVGDHFAQAVVETDLRTYLTEHAQTYSGVFVLRMENGPKPKRCRAPRPNDKLVSR